MRLIQTLPVLGFALTASCSSLNKAGLVMDAPVRRQVDVVSGVFSKISTDVQALDTAAKGFSGDAGALTQASNTLLADIKSGVTTIQNSQPLDITGATQIASSVTTLSGNIETTINDVIAAKSAIVKAGQGGTVYQALVDQKAASQQLSEATASKAPKDLQTVATQLSAGILSSLQKGIDAYADQKGSGSNPPSGGSSSGGGSAPTGSGTSKPTGSSPASPTTGNHAAPTNGCGAPPPTYGGSTPSTTKAAPPAQFTGAAVAQSPLIGFAVAAFGLVAAM